MREFAALAARLAEVERRLDGLQRPGRVTDVDLAAKRVRLAVGQDVKSPWVPYAQLAGGLKVHTPPTPGQQMVLFSPGGEFDQGLAIPLGWSDDNPSPADGGDPVLTFGQVRVELTEDGLVATVGDARLSLSAAGVQLAFGDQLLDLTDQVARLAGAKVETAGPTHLNGGDRQVAYKGGADSRGDTINSGADSVFV